SHPPQRRESRVLCPRMILSESPAILDQVPGRLFRVHAPAEQFHDHALRIRSRVRAAGRKPVRHQDRGTPEDGGPALSHRHERIQQGPQGKLPYIDDDGEIIADSTLIRWYLENKHRIDFDRGLAHEQKAVAWAFEKLAEDNLYWVIVETRWLDDDNFNRGPRTFFDAVPALMRPFIVAMVRRKVRAALWAQGIGRHSPQERAALGRRALEAIADYLAE